MQNKNQPSKALKIISTVGKYYGVSVEDLKSNMKPRVVATTVNNIIEEYLSVHQGLDAHVEGRIEILE